ncbi:MAG: DUF3426 domain-containing protein [Hydrogenophaga sp.]
MSYTTRCPACGTIFRVVTDQLKISDGWVRCGHCAEVFDASLYLAPWNPPPTLQEVAAPDPVSVDVGGQGAAQAPAAEVPSPVVPPSTPEHDTAAVVVETSAADAVDPSWGADVPGASGAEHAPDPGEPGFMRRARRQAFWRSWPVRAVMSVLVLLLLGLLVLQWAVQERHWLAARQPALLPLLEPLCAAMGYRIEAPRQIEAVVIESSTLARRLGNFYAFDLVIKNTATTVVSMPALELSLTDHQDRPIARRVFLPPELPGAPSVIPPQAALPLHLRLSIAEVDGVPMSGYRALVFYP